jgi:hypothetical protein
MTLLKVGSSLENLDNLRSRYYALSSRDKIQRFVRYNKG